MSIMGKRYPKEFRDDVVRVARSSDAPIKQIAEDFGISDASLYNWLKQADIDDGKRDGLTSAEADEMTAMKKRVRLLEQENEILRSAAAFFAKDISPK
jgi:transposase-like protein